MAQAYYTPRTVQTGQVPSTQTSFPALVLLNATRYKTIGNGGHVANANGYDIRFYSDSALTTALTYELVPGTYSASAGTAEFWVLVASLADAVTIYIGYGDPALNTDGSSTSTWDSNYLLVQHLPNGSSLTTNDSGQHGNNGTNNSVVAASGQIDGAGSFISGSSAYINGPALGAISEWTLEAWVNLSGSQGANAQIVADIYTGQYVNYFLGQLGGGDRVILAGYYDGNAFSTTPTTTVPSATWTYLFATCDSSGNLKLYVNNNSSLDTATSTRLRSSNNAGYVIGRIWSGSDYINGSIDEVRVSGISRSSDWRTSQFNNQSNNAAFWPDGTEVPVSSGTIIPRLDNSYRQRRAA